MAKVAGDLITLPGTGCTGMEAPKYKGTKNPLQTYLKTDILVYCSNQ